MKCTSNTYFILKWGQRGSEGRMGLCFPSLLALLMTPRFQTLSMQRCISSNCLLSSHLLTIILVSYITNLVMPPVIFGKLPEGQWLDEGHEMTQVGSDSYQV